MKQRSAVLLALCLLLPSTASADLLPPDHIEPCSLELMTAAARTGCVACSTSYQEPTACEVAHAAVGLVRACRTSGASVWSEIWCTPEAPAPSVPPPAPVASPPAPATAPPAPSPAAAPVAEAPPETASSFCSMGHARGSSPALALFAVALVALSRRRRRS